MTRLGAPILLALLVTVSVRLALRPAAPAPAADIALRTRSGHLGRLVLSLAAGALGSVLVPGATGAVAAVLAAAITWILLGRRTPAEELRRQRRVTTDLPVAVDLMASALRAGADPLTAVRAVVVALPGPAADQLGLVAGRLAMGGDPVAAWSELTDQPQLAPLGRALARAQRAGTSVAVAAERLAEDLRDAERLVAESRAKAVSTRAAAPLGLCFLPAFVLLGIVPLVVGLVGRIGLS